MTIKNLIALFLIVLLSSCSNLLHVEKRQYRKGFHIDNFFALNKQKNVLLSVKDTAIRQVYSQNNNIINKEDAMREDVVVLADNDSLIAETMHETVYTLPIVEIPEREKKKRRKETFEKTPDPFDLISVLIFLVSVIGFFLSIDILVFLPFLILIPTTISLRKLRKGKKKANVWFYLAMVGLLYTLVWMGVFIWLGITLESSLFLITSIIVILIMLIAIFS